MPFPHIDGGLKRQKDVAAVMKFLARGCCVGEMQSHSFSMCESLNLFINTFPQCFQIVCPYV